MLPPLTEREKRILFIIRIWQVERGYSPNARQIGEKFGVKRQSISQAISNLRKKGYIEMSPTHWRYRTICFPKGMTFPWGNESLPDELFGHLKPENARQVNGNNLQSPV